ncbi:hypothetical protein [Mycobacteroides franklinii]|uniref:Uncharacterized protein n=1 Tax=Mycobacteroides franklinii TaxID=948102 RepID=A0A4R8R8E4_9MYCO|nr:hypothetical protein [Mycobacteroides franklinii]TDZ43954.1 hypothetical protein CCUG64054_04019 [Mycobacteroides franklinii]TDZ51088.1 hypothetical protein CCUG63697_02604 [Mycobacteroides franklinii]TDZ57508.1 hypothetical protein CCUG63696_04015 [Mycobacteroides franklinii]TDZ64450.1 hypothetical protein CCUG63695_03946 [Mycobacteroides franklinii]TDZ70847.1 hypothetical protein CCUG64056_04019 [Mycobacteroides franklinii]
MNNDFAEQVQTVVGPLLADLGLTLDKIDSHVDEGGMRGSVVYYRAQDCKIQIYQSSREGSINCMIAPLAAPNTFGPQDRSGNWQYLTKFVPMPEMSLDELARSVSFEPKTSVEQLQWVRDNIADNFEAARTGVLSTP